MDSTNRGSSKPQCREIVAHMFPTRKWAWLLTPLITAITAVLFAVSHEWIYAVGFGVLTLIIIPTFLADYRVDRTLREMALGNLCSEEAPTPGFMAHRMRSLYKWSCLEPLMFLLPAALFAVWNEWMWALFWGVVALSHVPGSLSQHRQHKRITETLLSLYPQWYERRRVTVEE